MARELTARGVAVHQHGFAHENHEPQGRKCEFGPSRSRVAQRRDIAAGASCCGSGWTGWWSRSSRRLGIEEFARRFVEATPVGVMFHHAEMDDAAMDRAGELLALLAGHPRVVSRRMMELV